MITVRRFLIDCTGYNLLLGALLGGSLAYNAEMWVHDYPPDIKKKFGPRSKSATMQSIILAIPFFFILIGGAIWSNLRLKKRNDGRLPLRHAFANTYLLFLSFWVFDLTIMDWLFFVTIQPDFIVLPGTEGMAGYDDYGFHLKVALPALVWMIFPAIIIAVLTTGKA